MQSKEKRRAKNEEKKRRAAKRNEATLAPKSSYCTSAWFPSAERSPPTSCVGEARATSSPMPPTKPCTWGRKMGSADCWLATSSKANEGGTQQSHRTNTNTLRTNETMVRESPYMTGPTTKRAHNFGATVSLDQQFSLDSIALV